MAKSNKSKKTKKDKKHEVVFRNKEGYYVVKDGNIEHELISVTTLFDKVFGLPKGMIQYYFCKYGWEEAGKKTKAAIVTGKQYLAFIIHGFTMEAGEHDLMASMVAGMPLWLLFGAIPLWILLDVI